MPQNKFAIARYRIIDSLFQKHDYVKTSLMVESCTQRTGFIISRRTIQLDLEAMKYDDFLGFYSPIDYCCKRKAYYYTDPDYSISKMSFTQQDIYIIEYLLLSCKDSIPKEYYAAITNLIAKMKIFTK